MILIAAWAADSSQAQQGICRSCSYILLSHKPQFFCFSCFHQCLEMGPGNHFPHMSLSPVTNRTSLTTPSSLGGWVHPFWYDVQGDMISSITFGIDKQGGPTVQHRELCPISWVRTWWKIVWKKKEYVYVWLGHFAVQQKLKEHGKSTIL